MELTRKQLDSRKAKAERFLRNVLDDDNRADEVAAESVSHYAARRKIRIVNPLRINTRKSKSQGEKVMSRNGAVIRTYNPNRLPRPSATNSDGIAKSAAEIARENRALRRQNQKLQSDLDKVAALAAAPPNDENVSEDEMVNSLNKILDIAAPDDIVDDDDDDDDADGYADEEAAEGN
jgi:hypothetical protein